ncbi:uncharacterized protein LOC135848299 [Planococcus citri]|uniref:uncharacterized protein LOC135848299 n=1 Tax=Planococcus citri TaxID=170843 RepID=UPI0031F80996
MEYATSRTQQSALKCGRLLVKLIKRGSITKECVIELMKFFHDREHFSADRVNFWTSLLLILIPLFQHVCLRINDLETELPKNKVFLQHIQLSNGCLVLVLDNVLMDHLYKRLEEDNTDEIIKLIDARNNLENGRNSATLVSKLMTMICQIVYDFWKVLQKEEDTKVDADIGIAIHKTVIKYDKLLKNYIKNKNDLEMQCLLAVHEFVDKASYPSGLLPGIFESLYNLNLVSYDSFEQWKNSDAAPRFGVALSLLSQFFESIEETNVQISAAPKIKYTVEFLTTFRDLPECNKPVQIITKEIAAKVIRTQSNNEKKNEPKVGGFDRATYLKVISNSNSFTTRTSSERTNKTSQRTVTSPFIQSYSDWDEHLNY